MAEDKVNEACDGSKGWASSKDNSDLVSLDLLPSKHLGDAYEALVGGGEVSPEIHPSG